MRKSLVLGLVLLLAATTNAFAVGEARMLGKVLDGITKQPIADAVINIEATERKTFKQTVKVKKDGTYTILLMDGTINYKFTISAPGYTSYIEIFKLKLGANNVRDFELLQGKAATGGGTGEVKADPAVEAYNAGAALSNAGDYAAAKVKFEEAVAAKPGLTAGWMALAKINARLKEHAKAIQAANKVLEIDNEDVGMWVILFDSHTALGDKEKAAEAEKKIPANATVIFNQAARKINDGKDAEAEALLKQAVSLDEKLAVAWYELGMVYVRAGKNAEAKDALNKYIEIDPNGRDAAVAKEMIAYLK